MNKFRFLFIIVILPFLVFPVLSQAQKIDSMMNIYANGYPQEKIHIHFDKTIYTPGSTIWFKAYIFAGPDPSTFSRNFYLEVSDADGNILQHRSEPITESSTAGNIDLPQTIKGNHVHIRAFTTWMLNFDTAFFYEKDIRIFNRKGDSGIASVKAERRIQFFPEGGDLVAGLENMVAFKAADLYGLPIAVKGILRNASGKDLLVFESEHDGMGRFPVTPVKGDSLYVVWKDDLGIEHSTGLPSIKPAGAVLRAITAKEKILFSIARSGDADPEYKHLTIIGHMHQHLVYKARVNLEDNFMSGGTIPVSQLPSGVLQLTLFTSDDRPVAERVVFVNNHEFRFSPNLKVVTQNVNKRGKNTIEVEVPDTLRANLSLAVTDGDADGVNANDDNIISRLLLTGDIRGYVHDPYYYFAKEADSLIQQLDLVMMTHGWRRFKWEQLARGKTPVIKYPEQDYLSIKVDVLGVDPYKIAKDESLNLILNKKDSSTQMLFLPHLSGSKFGVSGLIFYDSVRTFYQFNTNRNLSNEAAITFSTGLYRGNRSAKPLTAAYGGWAANDSSFLTRNRFLADEAARIQPTLDKKIKTLASVTVVGRTKTDAQKLDEKYTSGLFSGGDAYSYDLVNDPFANSYTDIFAYLQGKVAGLQISTIGPTPSMSWRGSTPALYLNEMQVDVSAIQSTPVTDIAMVKVFRPGSGIGFGGGGGGTIAIYTKKGGDEHRNDPSLKGLEHTLLTGYSPVREFPVPDYSDGNPLNEIEDVRSTLYWKPYVLTDKDNRKVTIQFYNNDVSKKLRIVLEGINEDGKLSRIVKILQ
ncbi:MAG: hypothetical protein P4L51_19175 [Puia sp.]|nr:hypothetical protein [Puia sp.]